MKEILIKVINDKYNAYKGKGYHCINAALITVEYTAELALESGILSRADYAEIMDEFTRLYRLALKEE